jgi:hypothetical protein
MLHGLAVLSIDRQLVVPDIPETADPAYTLMLAKQYVRVILAGSGALN